MKGAPVNCPYCDFKFRVLVIGLEDLTPLVCQRCAEVSLVELGKIRKVTPAELEALKQSPAWEKVIAPAQRFVAAEKKKTLTQLWRDLIDLHQACLELEELLYPKAPARKTHLMLLATLVGLWALLMGWLLQTTLVP